MCWYGRQCAGLVAGGYLAVGLLHDQVTGQGRGGVHSLLDGVLVWGGATTEVLDVDDDPPGGGALSALDADVVVLRESANDHVGGGIPWGVVTQPYGRRERERERERKR